MAEFALYMGWVWFGKASDPKQKYKDRVREACRERLEELIHGPKPSITIQEVMNKKRYTSEVASEKV